MVGLLLGVHIKREGDYLSRLRGVQPRRVRGVACCNQAAFLSEAVTSVVRQTFGAWEVIIVDDGSPDDTANVAEQLIAEYGERIRLIRQANGGLAAARNAGIAAARGRYILPLDADDRLAPLMLERTTPCPRHVP